MIQIDAATLGQILSALISVATTIAAGLVSIALLSARRKTQALTQSHAEAMKQKDLEIEKQRQMSAVAMAEREKAAAEASRIRDESRGELIRKEAEARQMGQVSALLASQLGMLEKAFNRIADDSAEGRAVSTRVADTLAMVSSVMSTNHTEVITNLEGLGSTLNRVNKTVEAVDGKFALFGQKLADVLDASTNLTRSVQSAYAALLAERVSAPTPTVEINNHNTEVTP